MSSPSAQSVDQPGASTTRQVILLALPMLGEQLLNFLVGLVDTWLAGGISKEATLSVGAATYLGWFANVAFALVGVGAAAVISRSLGARDNAAANLAANQAMWLSLGVGVLVSGAVHVCAPLYAGFITDSAVARGMCAQYLQIIAWGYVLTCANAIGAAALRAAGDTVSPMRVMLVVNLVNLVCSLALVQGWVTPPLGVAGIALGTVAARCVGGLLMLLLLARGVRGLQLSVAHLRPNLPMTMRMLRVGLPACLDMSINTVGQLLFIRIVSRTALGDQATANFAAHVIAMQLEALSFMPAMALGTAAATLVGQQLGAQRPELARRAGHRAALLGAGAGLLAGLVFFALADAIFGLMTQEAAVRAAGVPAFRMLALVQPFLCMGIVYVFALRGAGDTTVTTLIAVLNSLLVRVPVAALGVFWFDGGLIGAWSGMWADNVVRFGMALWRFEHGGWQRIRV